MNIQTEKIEIVKLVLDNDNLETLTAIKQILKNNVDTDFWNKLSSDEKAEIRRGLEDIEKGRLHDYEDFIKDLR
ncbi:MAG: hypothetical protein ACLFQM_06620 [Fidelibacterota bacterium]